MSNSLDTQLLMQLHSLINEYLPDEDYITAQSPIVYFSDGGYYFDFQKMYRYWCFFEQVKNLFNTKLAIALTSDQYIIREFAQLISDSNNLKKLLLPKKNSLYNSYPLTIIPDRYSGTYSGGTFLAFYCNPHEVPIECYGDDIESYDWFLNNQNNTDPFKGIVFGAGLTPELAADNLQAKLNQHYNKINE